MICTVCGSDVKEGSKFCPTCGAPVAPQLEELKPDPRQTNTAPILDMPEPTAPMYAQVAEQPSDYPVAASSGYAAAGTDYGAGLPVIPQSVIDSIQTWGIVGLVCSFVFSILGIVFSAIAIGKARRCVTEYGYLPQQARSGRTMGIVGLVLSIVFTVLGLLVLLVLGAAFAYAYY